MAVSGDGLWLCLDALDSLLQGECRVGQHVGLANPKKRDFHKPTLETAPLGTN
jgi:hypothetical protein